MKLIYSFCLVILIVLGNSKILPAQARIIINNNAFLTMDNGVYLVIDNSNINAITTAGTGGNIISEDENNKVKWMVGAGAGAYIIPFTSAGLNKIPLTFQISAPGTGSGSIEFATYGGASWDNNTYRPSGVTNMTNDITLNNSAEVIDRFWLIHTPGYTTKPGGSINFTYIDAEHTAIGNTITEAELKAERYYTPTNNWDVYTPLGSANTAANTVNGVSVTAADFWDVWTLIDQAAHPLPITLLNYVAACDNSTVQLKWSTASESNAAYFIISKSYDGNQFYPVATIPAAGYSTEALYYNYLVSNGGGYYYKLQLVDTDLSIVDLGVVYSDCAATLEPEFHVYAPAPYQINVQAQNLPEGNYALSLFHLSGELCYTQQITISDGELQSIIKDPKLAVGIYIIQLTDLQSVKMVEKVFVRDY